MPTPKDAPYKLKQHSRMGETEQAYLEMLERRKHKKSLGRRQRRKLGLLPKPNVMPLPDGTHKNSTEKPHES